MEAEREMVALLCHETRNPLNVLSFFLHELARGPHTLAAEGRRRGRKVVELDRSDKLSHVVIT